MAELKNAPLPGGNDTGSNDHGTQTPVKKGSEIPTRLFLQKKEIKVRPVIRETKWIPLLDRKKRQAFMYNSTKRTFTLPTSLKTGALVDILDNVEIVKTPQYKEPVTEQQFFERQLGKDLNRFNKKDSGDNFWTDDAMSRILITVDGISLNLENPIHALHEKILLANRELIADSAAQALTKPTYQFYIEDAEVETNRDLEVANTEIDAYEFFSKIKGHRSKLQNYLKVANKGYNPTASEEWLKGEVFKLLKEDVHEFLRIATDPLFDDKAFVYDAVRVGAITRKSRDQYLYDGGQKSGSIHDTINYLNKPENSALYETIKARIDRGNS